MSIMENICNFVVVTLLADFLQPLADCIIVYLDICMPLQWRHNEQDCVSVHQPRDCLLNCLFRLGSKKTPVTDEFPAKKASNA